MIENRAIVDGERHNNRPPYKPPYLYVNTACECGKWEAQAEWRGQKLCAECLEGIVGVRLL